MDILELIRAQVGRLSEGPHSVGLRSVLRHIEVAYRHLSRGQEQQDDTAFTDAIYRTNQAFEGSVKEAYRVLAGKDPQKATPYNIELYLQQNGLFRQRVLSAWRNPSTHDYNLDFDEGEAFLAIVSVSAFAKLLIDQISEKITFLAVKEEVESQNIAIHTSTTSNLSLIDRIVEAVLRFLREYIPSHSPDVIQTEVQLLGALGGFLSSFEGDIGVFTNEVVRLPTGRSFETDMTLVHNNEKIIMELKHGRSPVSREYGLRHLEVYLSNIVTSGGILLIYGDSDVAYSVDTYKTNSGNTIRIVEPAAVASSAAPQVIGLEPKKRITESRTSGPSAGDD